MVSVPDERERMALHTFAEKAYLDYSMYVILDRALPHISDGLKPVQRRIVYAMSELGLSASSKPKKAARTVGDVLGKYHPHGDSACYEAMVLMAQPFSYRYPLIDGQGNWGSPDDPKSFAAMRYTEARLTAFARVLLDELDQGTVDFSPNFDGTLREPQRLPARVPHILLNGTTGIAVGMATDIPPHNLRELIDATIHRLHHPESDLETLCRLMPGPDYPGEADIITSEADLRSLYRSGQGSIRLRARYRHERSDVIVDALPHQVPASRVLEQIAAQMQARKLPMVDDLRDESDHENPVRLVLGLRSNRVDVEALMGHLFATTDLERSQRVNLNVITLDGRPKVCSLPELLDQWLRFRRTTVRRRLEHRLKNVERRLELIAGLLLVHLDIDRVIRIIREEEEPKPALIEAFNLSELQADAILDTKLRHLARLEEMKLRAEQTALTEEQRRLEHVLGDTQALDHLIAQELRADADRLGDARRSRIVAHASAARVLEENSGGNSEPVLVVLSQKGWIRAARGGDVDPNTLSYKTGDGLLCAVPARTHQTLVLLDDGGRAYSLPTSSLASARGHGEPLSSRLSPPAGAQFLHLLPGENDDHHLLATSTGFGFLCPHSALSGRNRAGKTIMTLAEGARILVPALRVDPTRDALALISSSGHLLLLAGQDLPIMVRGKGNRLLQLKRDGTEQLCFVVRLTGAAALQLKCGKRSLTLKATDLNAYRAARGSRGQALPRGFRKVEHATAMTEA